MSKPARFNTVPSDLVEHAETARVHFDRLGYAISIEPQALGYPKTPALRCKRKHTTVILEICEKLDIRTLRDWVALCRSTAEDVRVAVCVPQSATATHLPKHQNDLQTLGIGIYVSQGGTLKEWLAPGDLSLQVHLPDLANFPKLARRALGAAYEQFDRKQWREGFEEACKAIEEKSRAYLLSSIKSGRLTVTTVKKGKPTVLTISQAKRLTLGQLAHAFTSAHPQNSVDALIARTLTSINPDRIGVAHLIGRIKTEHSLRKNVGVHMHSIAQALKHIC